MKEHHYVRVADEVWIAAASLHRSRTSAKDFSINEIVAQAERENITGKPLRPGVKIHIYQHGVANRPPQSGNYRVLFATVHGRRRLFRPGDPCHPSRSSGKMVPNRDQVPAVYGDLIDWYENVFTATASSATADTILTLRGQGAEVWAGEDADAYVRRLREGRR